MYVVAPLTPIDSSIFMTHASSPAREGRLSSHPPMRLRYLEANLQYDPIMDGHYVG